MRKPKSPVKTGKFALATLAAALAIVLLPPPVAAQSDAPAADDAVAGTRVVDFAFVRAQIVFPAKPDVTIIDSRPAAAGFAVGHIPGAISIPDDSFGRLAATLPLDRRQMLIFYCTDDLCAEARQSALRAERLGYSNTRVYEAGFADWRKRGGPTSVAAEFIDRLIHSGMPHTLIDARPARTAAKGMIPGATNIPDSEFDKHVARLPADRGSLLIYYCGGIDCPQSSNSAEKARVLGYTNVKTYAEGYPEWLRLHAPAVPPEN